MALSRAVLIGMCPVKPQGWVMDACVEPTHFPNIASKSEVLKPPENT